MSQKGGADPGTAGEIKEGDWYAVRGCSDLDHRCKDGHEKMTKASSMLMAGAFSGELFA